MFIFSVVILAISLLPGSRVAVISAHQPVELPRKLLTEPWVRLNAGAVHISYLLLHLGNLHIQRVKRYPLVSGKRSLKIVKHKVNATKVVVHQPMLRLQL